MLSFERILRWAGDPIEESPQPNVLGSGSLRTLSPLFWVLVVVTGAGAGLAGGLLMLLLQAVEHLSWPYQPGNDFVAAVENATPVRIVLVVTAAGLLAGVVRQVMRRETNGGHGGELAQRIWFGAGQLDPVHTMVRAVLSIVIVGMGASLGRESAPKQIGTLIASLLARWGEFPTAQRRLLAACGAGAGIAAVYNVPFGGAMFALEVLLGTISLPLVPPAFAASLTAVAVSWLMLPNVSTYAIPFYPVSYDMIIWALIAGPVVGLVSVLYVRLISSADRVRPSGRLTVIAPVLVFGALGALAIPYPQLLGNGKDLTQELFLGQLGLPVLLVLLILKPIATAACLGSGAPGGLFTPTLTVGALLGGVLGHLWLHLWPAAPLGGFAIVGACAVLAASTQGPVSALVLLLEMTRRLDTLMVPTVLATAGAVLVARRLEHRSIYSARIHSGRSAAGRAGASQADAFIALSSAARPIELLRALLRTESQPKPIFIVDEQGALVGGVSADRVRDPPPETLPLETATAGDFATPIQTILTTDDEALVASKFQVAETECLPVVIPGTGELVGVRRRPV